MEPWLLGALGAVPRQSMTSIPNRPPRDPENSALLETGCTKGVSRTWDSHLTGAGRNAHPAERPKPARQKEKKKKPTSSGPVSTRTWVATPPNFGPARADNRGSKEWPGWSPIFGARNSGPGIVPAQRVGTGWSSRSRLESSRKTGEQRGHGNVAWGCRRPPTKQSRRPQRPDPLPCRTIPRRVAGSALAGCPLDD